MPDIAIAVKFMIDTANDDSHGYDQTHRNSPDYDCSSLVATALNKAGFNISVNSWTGNLEAQLRHAGFTDCKAPWQAGDVHLKVGKHVVMSVSPDKIAHASINELGKTTGGKTGDQTGKEICVTNYYNYKGGWDMHLRYSGKSLYTVAREVIKGKYGNGLDRKKRLKATGYDPKLVQNLVNQLLKYGQ